MPVVNHERAWVRLKEVVLSKNSHGQRDLLHAISTLEVECVIPESEEGFDERPIPISRNRPSDNAR